MINRFKKYFKELKQNQAALKHNQLQLFAHQQLQAFAGVDFIPHTSWSMTPQAILHILNIIVLKGCKNIIEFGSGATTLYIAKMLKQQGMGCQFVSVESDPEWKKTLERQVKAMQLEDQVTFIFAPLEKVPEKYAFESQKTWYSTEKLETALQGYKHFDLIIVDGPFGRSTPFARYSAYPFLSSKSDLTTTWFLDDTSRPEEAAIISEWQMQSGLKKQNYNRYSLLMWESAFDIIPYRLE
ncbi:hypothetical protein ACH3PA_11535 [Leeuwenhoekiella sp. A2]|uniref:hypothetical protein n=1 Tax=Leeuwenhoekiella sp. A2 TaxID=3141460 RepID=UPI003A80F400